MLSLAMEELVGCDATGWVPPAPRQPARSLAGCNQIPPAKEGTNAKGDRPARGAAEEGLNRDGSPRNNFGSGSHGLVCSGFPILFGFFFPVQLPSFSPPFLQLPSKPGVCVWKSAGAAGGAGAGMKL